MSDAKVTSLAQLRAMTPRQIVDAKAAGRLDLGALASERKARKGRVRQLIDAGIPAAEAVQTIDQPTPPDAA